MSFLLGGDLDVEFDERGLLKRVGTRDVQRDPSSGTIVRLSQTMDGVSSLASWVVGHVEQWRNRRDIEHRKRWMEYYRLWKGIWSAEDMDRISERSHAIMPALAQAVDSAVAEMEEATFGRERWFDVDDGENRELADRLLTDFRGMQFDVSRIFLLGAIYGTGIGKIVLQSDGQGGIRQTLAAVEPLEFIPDPAGRTIAEMMGCAHAFVLPRNVVLDRQQRGIYEPVDPGQLPDHIQTRALKSDEITLAETEAVGIIEYHGLVPRKMLPEPPDAEGKLDFEDDEMVEAIVTVGNESTLLKAVANPLTHRDRAFVSYQHFSVPNRFWGMGVMERGYWPQKVLDSEIRARIDALAFSTHPMMGINSVMIPRGDTFQVRPGRNILVNGAPSEALFPLKFPPPDPQTYTQSAEMQRMIEMATGQMQAATPLSVNDRNNTASGMSMILGASIRRTKRTMANIEREFIRPLIRKVTWRFQQFDPTYPLGSGEFKVFGTLGIMAREFEQVQLTQLMNALPPGPQSLLIMRAVIDNSSIVGKEDMIQVVDQLLEQALNPEPPPPDLGAEARLLSAQARAQEVQANSELKSRELQLRQIQLQLDAQDKDRNHKRGIMAISVEADKSDAAATKDETQAILNLAKAQAEEQAATMRQLQSEIEAIKSAPPTVIAGPDADGTDVISALRAELDELRAEMLANSGGELADAVTPIQIERDSDGLIVGVNGRRAVRDDNGLIMELR